MTEPIKLFEPVTNDQIKKIHSRARETGLAKENLYKMVAALIGIPTITALSKQEAIFLIDIMQGQTKWKYPAAPRYENEISGDTSTIPSFYHIRYIRLWIKELGWDKDHMKNWLTKYRKVKDIRSMDRKQANDSFIVLKGMVERKRAADQDNNKMSTEP